MIFFAYEVFCLTFLQKIVIPLNFGAMGGPVQVALPMTYLGLFGLVFFAKFKVDLTRLALFTVFMVCAGVSIITQQNAYSANSVLLMVAIYLPFILYIDVSESTYQKMIQIYLNVMLLFSGVVLLQHISQLIWGWHVWPNLDLMIPSDYLFDGFIYNQPIKWGSQFNKPTGEVFLEVSYLSQWTAVALALELVYFRRTWRMIAYSVTLLACFAGTGLLLLVLAAPVLLTRVSRKSLIGMAVVALVCLGVVVSINWVGDVQSRFLEFQSYNSSAHNRFITPFQVLADFSQHVSALWTGEGPGNGDKSKNEFWWVITKLTYEYGYITTISFFVFLFYVVFKGSPSQRISVVLMILYNFMGGFIIPVYPILVFLLGGLFRIRKPKPA